MRQFSQLEPTLSFDAVIMLFPPNQGAWKADQWHQRWWYRLTMGPSGQQLTRSFAEQLPVPSARVYVIAGALPGHRASTSIPGPDDGTVAVDRTVLPGMQEHIVLPVGHTHGMNKAAVLECIDSWLTAE